MEVQINKKSLFIHIKSKEGEEYINTEHITNFSAVGCMLFIYKVGNNCLSFTFDSEEQAQEQKDYLISAINIHSKL